MSPLAVMPAAEKRPAVLQALAITRRWAGRGGRRLHRARWLARLGVSLRGRPRLSVVADRPLPWRSGVALPPRMPLLPALGLLLALGFGSSALISYLAARASNESQIAGTTLPLTAETIDAELESQLFQKVAVARAMAANTFLEQWLEAGEQDPAEVIAYLRGVR